jgi:adenosylcobinamide-GDP ribazoletransferase
MILWGALRSAVAFLTRIPVGQGPIEPRDRSWSPALFPVVGAALGCVTFGAFRLTQPLGITAAATVATALAVLMTGALHEDGLADSADGLLGAVSRERALEIMKDGRIGTYGTVALILALVLRIHLLSKIGCESWLPLVLSPSLGRLGPVWLMTHLDHAAPTQAKQKDLVAIGPSRAWWASAIMLVMTLVLLLAKPEEWPRFGAAWLGACMVTVYVWRLARRRLGGITGDLLGACEQLGEVTILAVFAAGG